MIEVFISKRDKERGNQFAVLIDTSDSDPTAYYYSKSQLELHILRCQQAVAQMTFFSAVPEHDGTVMTGSGRREGAI